jgi:hypothetical protein
MKTSNIKGKTPSEREKRFSYTYTYTFTFTVLSPERKVTPHKEQSEERQKNRDNEKGLLGRHISP